MYDLNEICRGDFLSKKLNAYMAKNNITRYRLVKNSSLGRTTVYRLLNGSNSGSLKTWLIMCNDLGITLDELLEGEEDEV